MIYLALLAERQGIHQSPGGRSMNILILTIGTFGDVLPFLALGEGLKNAGHEVTLCTADRYRSLVTDRGLGYGPMTNALLDLLDAPVGRAAMEEAVGLAGLVKTGLKLAKAVKPISGQMMRDAWQAARAAQPDIVIYHTKILAGPHIAEKLGIPAVMASLQPALAPTKAFPAAGLPDLKLGGWHNELTYRLVALIFGAFAGVINEFRRETLGLDPFPRSSLLLKTMDGTPIPILHAFSRHVVPRPKDWAEHIHLTGYWFADQASRWRPPEALETFLQAGEPPVYVGFGSMVGCNSQHLGDVVVTALTRTKKRAIVATGWGALKLNSPPDNILEIEAAPHEWLFPRVAGVVHHGGAGTTAMALRAGRPSIMCPFFGDQPFWARRIHELRAGPAPIPRKKLTAERLSAAITEATSDPLFEKNARALSERIRSEDGVAEAVTVIENVAAASAASWRRRVGNANPALTETSLH
jgi:sterol 3beta-glucosyltransferase